MDYESMTRAGLVDRIHALEAQTAALVQSRENEEALRQRALIFENATDAIMILDLQRHILDWNPASERLFGYRKHEVLGRTTGFLYHPEDYAKYTPLISETIARGERWVMERVMLHKDGTERFCETIRAPLLDAGGTLIGRIGLTRDITERRQAEQAAAAQSRLVEAVFDHNVSCLVVLDRDFNFLRVNDAYARACGKDISEFVGRNHFDMYPSDAKLIFDKVVRDKRPFETFARPFVFPDQPERGVTYWDWTLVPVLGQRGEVQYLVFSLNEVTGRKQAEIKMREYLERMRSLSGQLLEAQETERRKINRELHDEIGHALTGIKIALELAIRRNPEAPNQYIEQARESINELIGKTRDLSSDWRPTMLDDLGLLPALLWQVKRFKARSGMRVVFKHSGLGKRRFPPGIETAAYRIVQETLTNVARHACINEVDLTIWIENEGLSVWVEDRGAGFDPAAVSLNGKGSGLIGMQERVKLLNGTMNVESCPGGGTRIQVWLPISDIVPAER